MSWRVCPFKKGQVYSVRKDHKGILDDFRRSELLEFVEESYSTYDSATIYVFQSADEENCKIKRWFLHDDESELMWLELFVRVE